MALATKKACLIWLHFNLALCVLALMNTFIMRKDSAPSYFEYYDISSSPFVNSFYALIGCAIIAIMIVTIYEKESPQCCLVITISFLLIQSLLSIYTVILLDINTIPKNASASASEVDNTYQLDRKFYMNVICVFCLFIELYSALVCYSYKEELKQRSVRENMLLKQTTDIPSPTNAPFIAAPYPNQRQQYAGQSPQYSDPPAQNSDIPLQYFTQPTYNPDVPPPYCMLFAPSIKFFPMSSTLPDQNSQVQNP